MRWRKAAILGVGLLGGSLGMALRRRGLAAEVAGYVRREGSVTEALAAGAVDVATTRLETAVQGADLVVLCTPLAQMDRIAPGLPGLLRAGALVTDVGSAKVSVVRALESVVARAGGRFVGSHPMAGSERTGVGAAREDLFQGAVTVVTPTRDSDPGAVEEVTGLWTSLGARVVSMAADRHDALVSRSSHLPHLVAAALVHGVLDSEGVGGVGQLCAAGFRDTTRVASGSPEMWRDIALANRTEILAALERLEGILGGLREMVGRGDAAGIEAFLRSAKAKRDGWCEGGGKWSGE